jgi:hypothetical protein
MKNVIEIEEVVNVTFKIEPLLGNTETFEQQIKAAFRKISRTGERIYVEIGEFNYDECVSGVTYENQGEYIYARITEIELFIEQQIEIFKTTIFA